MRVVREHVRPKVYFDEALFQSVDDSSLLGLDPKEKIKQDEQASIILNSTLKPPKTKKDIPTKCMFLAYMKTVEINDFMISI